ncbi:MAG: DUF4349 domain-containing protein [Bacteroidales bacterium]|nr:DUF4349 domain-containing protein [Bacteroidales bacterium]MCM1414313.1 DUF4349 domain-containing protein [bacterium]MCM1422193.1 DUF4349 domain-containing protein [bacterium]
MNKRKVNGRTGNRLRVLVAAVSITSVIAGCGSAGKNTYEMSAESATYDTAADAGGVMTANQTYEYAEAEAAAEEAGYAPEPQSAEAYEQEEASVSTERKLIKTVNINAETEAFDTLVPTLQSQVEALGGYIESISVYDVNSYYVEDRQVKQRCANLTARVPKEKLDGFLSMVGEQTNVTSRSENVEDVTLQYVDLESHKKALLTEQDRLLELLEQAESVEDIISIEGRLSEVRYQLESMESRLRTYDNQIDYSTVYLSIEEVRQYTPTQTATVWQRIGNGFRKSLTDIGIGIQNLAIGFVIDIPYIVLGIVLIAAAVLVLRILWKAWKKHKMRKRDRKAAADGEETEDEEQPENGKQPENGEQE